MNQDLIDYELSYLNKLDIVLSMSIEGLMRTGDGEFCKLRDEVNETIRALRALHRKVRCRHDELYFSSQKEVT